MKGSKKERGREVGVRYMLAGVGEYGEMKAEREGRKEGGREKKRKRGEQDRRKGEGNKWPV